MGKINSVMHHEIDEEIMIWGASTAYVNLDAVLIERITGMTCFNMGIDGTNIDQYYGLLNEYLTYTKKCKYLVIVLDIYSSLECRDKFYNIHNWLHHFKNPNIYDNMKDINPYFSFKARYIPYYDITSFDKHSMSHVKRFFSNENNSFVNNKGSLLHDSSLVYNGKTNLEFKTKIDKRVFDKVKKGVVSCKQRNIIPIILISPCFEKGISQVTNQEYFLKEVDELKEFGAVIFNHLKAPFHNDSSAFKDNTHLNAKGAHLNSELFNNKLLNLSKTLPTRFQ
jgi:hypothetical protein